LWTMRNIGVAMGGEVRKNKIYNCKITYLLR
jgi:hypothetical protein